jgi:ferric-dicitrate binding protein FerR (iron transport regulator)
MKKPVWVSVAILVMLAGANALKAAGPNVQWLGVLWTKGAVSVGNAKVSSGTTVLPGDVITTAAGASAWVRFRSPASTILLADTELALLASDSTPSFLLRRGTVIVNEKVADPIQVALPGAYVLVKGDAQNGAECEMTTAGQASTVSVRRGLAEIRGHGAPVLLRAGESAHVQASPQGGGEQPAGKINKVIPSGQIEREGSAELPLALNQTIDWNDLVRTLQTGRAQITLLDGSTLNVGARSELRILKHDPQSQQTQIEMTMGRLEANVQKITASGGKFELRSKSAVIGTIDTAFVVSVSGDVTKVCGVEGTTLVQSSDPNITKSVRLHRHECTTVIAGSAPTDPVLAPGEMAGLLDQTSLTGIVGGAAVAGGTSVPWTWVGVGGGVLVGSAVAGVVLYNSRSTSPTSP